MYCHLVVRQGLVWLNFIIIRAEKVNAYYVYIGQIKTSSSVDMSFVCCSESFDRHMEPHSSRFAKIRGARFAPPMGSIPHPTLLYLYYISPEVCLSVGVRKRQVAILARSSREMSLTDRIV